MNDSMRADDQGATARRRHRATGTSPPPGAVARTLWGLS